MLPRVDNVLTSTGFLLRVNGVLAMTVLEDQASAKAPSKVDFILVSAGGVSDERNVW